MVKIVENKIPQIIDLCNNFLVADAVERRLAIVGEALSKATKLNSDIIVSHQKKIIALRHIIIHDYDIVDSSTI